VPALTVATFNIHWGRGGRRSGWRPFDVVEACKRLDADVIVLQESWAPDDAVAQHDAVAEALGAEVVVVPLSRSVLEPKLRVVSRADLSAARQGDGDWCLALLSRLPITAHSVVPLPQLRVDPSSRAVLRTHLDLDGRPFEVAATHFSHLEFGSPLQARALRQALPHVDRPAAFLGDMNMWGWTVSAMVTDGWRRAVRGKTWPAHRPGHQIDHVLVTPSVEVLDGEVLPDLGSDHRPIRARLRIP
jgi:endonuclease/exonuclease/phosphatase family metal-dependent hydrolase